MKVTLPENQKEITLGQYQEYFKLNQREDLDEFTYNKRKVKIFTGLKYSKISAMKLNDLKGILQNIDVALNQESPFVSRFKMAGVEFGFIPNFDDMKAKEYFDLSTYDTQPETLHKLMAILFRPIKDSVGENYNIKNYQGTNEWADAMKQTPLNIVNGALFFFSSLASELESYTLKFTAEELARTTRKDISKSGDGWRRLTNWLRAGRGNMTTSKT